MDVRELGTTVITVILTDPSSSSLTDEEADEQPPSVGSFVNHSMSIALFTSQVLSQIKSGTLVMLVYGRETVLQVVHNRGHGFQKVLPCRGAQIATHTRSTSEKTKSKPNEAFTTKQSQDSEIFQGATPWSTPATKLADSETDPRFEWTAVNDWEPKTRLVDTAKTCPDPKQYSVLLAQS